MSGFAGGEEGGFESGFHGFKAGIGENGFAGLRDFRTVGPALKGEAAEFAGQFGLEGVGMNVAHGVQQLAHLPAARGDDRGVGMARGGHAKRGGQVEIFFAFGVPDVDAPGRAPRQWARKHPVRNARMLGDS